MTKRFRRQREYLWRQNPCCHWCGCMTVLPDERAKRRNVPANLATIDHLRPRTHPGRLEPNPQRDSRRVLACHACNQRRGDEEYNGLPVELRRERSKRVRPVFSNPLTRDHRP